MKFIDVCLSKAKRLLFRKYADLVQNNEITAIVSMGLMHVSL